MSETAKFLAIATVFLLSVAAGWYLLVYRPDSRRLQSVEGDVEDLILKLQSFTVSEKQIEALEEQIKKLQDKIAITESKIITKDELSPSLQQMKRRAKSYGLKFERILPDLDSLIDDPEERDSPQDIMKLKVDMKLKGRYKNFGNFVSSFRTFPFHVSIYDLRLLFNQEIHPELDIIVEARFYLRPDRSLQGKT